MKTLSVVLFIDIWFYHGHSVSCLTISCQNLQITRSNIRPHKKWAISLVLAGGHLIFLMGLSECVWSNILTLSPERVTFLLRIVTMWVSLIKDTWQRALHSYLYILQSQIFSWAASMNLKLRHHAGHCGKDTHNGCHCSVNADAEVVAEISSKQFS